MFNQRFTLARFLAALVVTSCLFSGCNTFAKRRLVGVYHREQTGAPNAAEVQQLEITADKFILSIPITGEIASDYTVEGDRIYVGGQPGQLVFNVDGLGVISNQANMGIAGTYVK
ncbi:MAG: hypothetical protein ACRYF0_14725 [Janthinobacterium lividum]